MTEDIICHPLRPVCVMLNMVAAHLYRKRFMSPNLKAPIITDDTIIRYNNTALGQKQVTADPTVGYTVGSIGLSPTSHGAMSNNQLISMECQVAFEVSTASYALTQELALEIAALCMAMLPQLKQENCVIKGAQVSGTKQDPNSTFFLSTVSVTVSLGYPVWNTTELDGTLREIRLKVNTPALGESIIK